MIVAVAKRASANLPPQNMTRDSRFTNDSPFTIYD